MRITKEQSVYQLTTMPRMFPVNCYLVEEEKELTLVDAAMPFSAAGILKAAGDIGKPITRIVITHAHEDHVGALDKIKAAVPDARVYISRRDARLIEGDRSLDAHEAQTPIKGGVPKKMITRPDVLLEEGDKIGSLLAISSPGHTPGSMSFMDVRNNIMIAGDAFQTRAGFAISGQVRFWFPFPALATWDKKTAVASAEKLLSYRPSVLAIGHGEMLKAPEEHIRNAIMLEEAAASKA
ncbi:MBL fold metallo-hydrolase [Fictibacillus aquaticus]|uniref:MBL fold metallo-hydrolase n=1 Tax=Fictibacillus aquaticus TaxID=2021314 RepID=A0A235F7P3_9BACL|nr:MBL fold metallo-hydrolase [Fictibacillus aquaticus]OYD57268.1 MBL fold metallo-hydrolase [Fictibacillus aquaticus]